MLPRKEEVRGGVHPFVAEQPPAKRWAERAFQRARDAIDHLLLIVAAAAAAALSYHCSSFRLLFSIRWWGRRREVVERVGRRWWILWLRITWVEDVGWWPRRWHDESTTTATATTTNDTSREAWMVAEGRERSGRAAKFTGVRRSRSRAAAGGGQQRVGRHADACRRRTTTSQGRVDVVGPVRSRRRVHGGLLLLPVGRLPVETSSLVVHRVQEVLEATLLL